MRVSSQLHVIRQSEVNNFSIGLLFFLLTVFPAVPYSGAVTIEAIYTDARGIGFNDTTGLTEGQRARLGDGGNNASTLGQARRNAFEHAAGLLEEKLPGPNTIRVEASFRSFGDETTVARTLYGEVCKFPSRRTAAHSVPAGTCGEDQRTQL